MVTMKEDAQQNIREKKWTRMSIPFSPFCESRNALSSFHQNTLFQQRNFHAQMNYKISTPRAMARAKRVTTLKPLCALSVNGARPPPSVLSLTSDR